VGLDLVRVLYPDPPSAAAAAAHLNRTALAQPAIFTVAYAMAELWASWGVQPHAMLGHSVGEFVAARLAGVLSLEDALRLVAARGAMMDALPGGAMLSVRLPESEVFPYLNDALSLAASNAPSLCVVAGPHDAIDDLAHLLDARNVPHRRLHTSHAFHSPMMDPIVSAFTERVREVKRTPPRVPFVSCVTGDWITDEQATDPAYWAAHLRQPVRFSQAVQVLRAAPEMILVETGPGTTLQTLARQQPVPRETAPLVMSSMAGAGSHQGDAAAAYDALGRLWGAGVDPRWDAFYAGETRRRVPLPTYPFDRKRYWAEPEPHHDRAATQVVDAEVVPAQDRHENEQDTKDRDMLTNHAATIDRTGRIVSKLVRVIQDLSGLDAEDIDPSASFLELGFDSLFLTQVAQALHAELDVTVTFRQLLQDTPSLVTLATYLDQQLPPTAFQDDAPSGATSGLSAAPVSGTESVSAPLIAPGRPTTDVYDVPGQPTGGTVLERILQQQLQTMEQVMARQLQAVRDASVEAVPVLPLAPRDDVTAPPVKAEPTAPRVTTHEDRLDVSRNAEFKPFGPYKPIQKGTTGELTPRQEVFLRALVERYTRKTGRSKQLTQEYRPSLADPRAVAGFRAQWKEMVYPIVTNRSQGSKLWDVDGNEYIDLVNGFGPISLGHRPEFVTRAIREQLDEGIEIGPQTPLAGDVAKLICKLTGVERVTFCNTGSEAVMAALRIARTVTGRKKIVFFSGSYHGTFDEVLVKRIGKADAARTGPIAPGIPQDNIQNVVILDYGTPESLEWIRAHAHELAAVLVEPVQSRHPALQPRAFLHEIRRITAESGCALIIDEIVTGFRVHPGGIQALFDIRADLVTYGKVLGGGMPIGVLAGTASFMDALDGGMWEYGDDSYPEVGVTFFAGTFVRHPLVLAAAKAVLEHLDEQGPALQERVAARTAKLVARLNDLFERQGVPTRIETFSSVFYFTFPGDVRFGSILYYLLREKGIHIQEGFPCFLSTAHSEEDVERVYEAFAESVAEMQRGEFLPPPPPGAYTILAAPATVALETTPDAPLTEPQAEIWVSTQLGPEASCAYNEAFTLSLTGDLDEAALRDAVQGIVDRHDALRAVFDADGSTVRFKPRLELEIPLVDLTHDEAPDDGLQHLIRENARTPFDLVRGPLVRATLMRLAPQHHALLFTAHHIICDGWSTNVIIEEFGALYSANRCREAADLPAPASFHAYAERQHAQSASESGSAESSAVEKYWLAQFTEPASALDLPTDRPRPAVKSFRGATLRRTIEPELQQALKRVGIRQGCTLFATLLAGFEVLLCRLSGQRDVVVGIPAAAQALVDGPTLVGHCVNFLALRGRFREDTTFAAFLAETQGTLLGAYEHQHYTYGTLLRKLSIRRDPGRQPLIEAQFNLEKIGANARFDNLEAAVDPCAKEFVTFDLFLNVVETSAGLVVDCEYNTDLFDADTIGRWLGHYQTLLAGVVSDPDQPLSALPLLTATERHRLLVEWNSTSADCPRDASIHELFAAQAARTPDAVAVVCGDERLTYADLDGRADHLAYRLRRLGVGPEALVGICVERSSEMVVGLLGILKAGGAYVPLDPAYPKERLAFMLADAGVAVLLTQERLLGRLPAHEAHVICLDADWPAIAAEPVTSPTRATAGQSLAYVIYTSGSTGTPKGTLVTHTNVVRLFASTQAWFQFDERDVWTLFHSYAFDFSVWELWGALLHGGRLVVVPYDVSRDPEAFYDLVRRERVTVLNQTPSAFTQFMRAEAAVGGDTGLDLRLVIFGGETLVSQTLAPWFERHGDRQPQLVNMYGITETTVHVTYHPLSAIDLASTIGSAIGTHIPDLQIYILDAHLQPVPIGVPGELYVGGAGVARGYLNRPALTAERFIPDPFGAGPAARLYKTGDLARYRPGGTIEFLGRLDDQVKIRGFRIELGEIEAVLRRHRAIQEAAVLAREDILSDQRLVAYVVAKGSDAPATAELRRFLEAQLPAYMVPSMFVRLSALPLTPNGKVDRHALPAPDSAHDAADANGRYAAARTPVEALLADLWREVLGQERIGIYDDFFEAGGHSLLATQVIARARASFGVDIPLRALFDAPTIAALAEAIEGFKATDAPSRMPSIRRVPREAHRVASSSPATVASDALGGGEEA